MIPIHLTIQGLYSYQEKQSVDFTKLTSANIFGIFGSVGSGKSSILEAITFALYGKTDRLNLSGDNRNYNMMNLKSDELLIEFTFKSGKQNTEYQIVAKAKRNSKKFDDVKTIDRTAYKKENNSLVPIDVTTLPTIIGLSYENFKRTIIIPQGRFQEFLQLGDKDRTQMLKELFNLDKYEFYYKVVALEGKNNEKKQNISGQLQQLGEINLEEITKNHEKAAALKSEIEQESKLLEEKQKENNEYSQLKELFSKKNELQKKVYVLNSKKEEFALLESKIREFEYCLLNFKALLDNYQSNKGKIQKLETTVFSDKHLLELTIEQAQKLDLKFEIVKKDYDKRDAIKQEAEELQGVARLNELSLLGLDISKRIEEGNNVLSNTNTLYKQLLLEKEALSETIKSNKLKLPDLTELSKIKEWHTINKNLLIQKHEIEKEIAEYKEEASKLDMQIQEFIKSWNFNAIDISFSPQQIINELKAKLESLKIQIAENDQSIEHLLVQSKLEDYAEALQDGKACPLCGSTEHPAILNSESVANELLQARTLKKDKENEISIIDQCINQMQNYQSLSQLKQEQIEKSNDKSNNISTNLLKHAELFNWERYSDEELLLKAFSEAEIIKTLINTDEQMLESILQKIDKELKNKEKYKDAIEKLKQDLAICQTELGTIKSQITIANIGEYKDISKEIILKKSEALKIKWIETEKQYEQISVKTGNLKNEQTALNTKIAINQAHLNNAILENAGFIEKINSQLDKTAYKSIEEINGVLSLDIDIEKEKRNLSDYMQNLSLSANQLEIITVEIGNKEYNEEYHQQIQVLIKQINEALNHKNQEYGRIESLIKKQNLDLETSKQLKLQLETLELRAEDIKTLKKLFTASGFVNYISSVYLQNLCNAANDRFYKLTRQKLSLEINEDNSFQVRDFMNGGKVRNVKTLSGGQTFQAALSLALSLADNIQKITESDQNFFFLDEGFGSLDKDSLEIVFDTLKSLRKENRIVGVISHVEDMQQEIDTHLLITNYEDVGSIIKRSWN
ncbi:MAG: SMC family ATPase [Bacteroidota bacterium]